MRKNSIILFCSLFLLFVGCSYGEYYQLQLIDQSTQNPIVNTKVELQKVIYCEIGSNCPLKILFTTKTNDDGVINVPISISESRDRYYLSVSSDRFGGTLVKQKKINMTHWDHNIIYVDWQNKEGTASKTKEFDIRKEVVVIKLWPREYWKK